MVRTSWVWDFLKESKEGAVCCIKGCGKQIKRGPSTSTKCFLDHFKHNHRTFYDQKTSAKKRQDLGDSEEVGNEDAVVCEQPQTSRQVSLEEVLSQESLLKRKNEKEREDLVLALIIKNNLPFAIVEEPIFRTMVSKAFPKVHKELASRNYFAQKLLQEKASEALKPLVQSLRDGSFAITCDFWSHKKNALLSVTVHQIDACFLRKNGLLAAIPCGEDHHTGETVSKLLNEVFDAHQIPKRSIVALVRDDGANMIKGASVFGIEKDSFQCIGHALHNAITSSIRGRPTHKYMLEKFHKLAGFFGHSTYGQNALTKELKSRKMKPTLPRQEVAIRWNSTYYMMKSILEVQPVLDTVLRKIGGSRAEKLELPTEEEVARATALCEILKVVDEQTKILSAEAATCSLYIPVLMALKDYTEKCSRCQKYDSVSDVVETLKGKIEAILKSKKDCRLLCLAMYVDPRFVKKGVLKDSEWELVEANFVQYAEQYLFQNAKPRNASVTIDAEEENGTADQNLFNLEDSFSSLDVDRSSNAEGNERADGNLVADEEPNFYDYWQNLDKSVRPRSFTDDEQTFQQNLKYEMNRFSKEASIPVSEDPLQWYRKHGSQFPLISCLARRLLAIPPTSVASERLFSKATLIFANGRRSRLKAEKLHNLLLLKANATVEECKKKDPKVDALLFPEPQLSRDEVVSIETEVDEEAEPVPENID